MFAGAAAKTGGNVLRSGVGWVNRAPRTMKGLAFVAILGTTAGSGTGFLDRIENLFSSGMVVKAGEGHVKSTFTLNESCYGGYVTKVDGAKADFHVDVGPLQVFDVNATYNGDITTDVCTKNANVPIETVTKNGKRHVTVTIPPDAITTKVFQTNPMDPKSYSWGNNFAAGFVNAGSDLLKGLPFVGSRINGMDSIHNTVGGFAFVGATVTAVDGCFETAMGQLDDGFVSSEQQQIANYANFLDTTDAPITGNDVTVDISQLKGFHPHTPFHDQLLAIQKALKSHAGNETLTLPSANSLHCQVSANIHNDGTNGSGNPQQPTN